MKNTMSALLALAAASACAASAFEKLPTFYDGKTPVVVETAAFRLVITPDATARSLVVKATGEEMLEPREGIPEKGEGITGLRLVATKVRGRKPHQP